MALKKVLSWECLMDHKKGLMLVSTLKLASSFWVSLWVSFWVSWWVSFWVSLRVSS